MQVVNLDEIDLIKELGIDKLPKEEQEAMIAQMSEVIQQRVLMRLYDEMNEEQRESFGKLLEEQAEPEKIGEFLSQNVPNLDDLAKQEVDKYKNEIMGIVGGNEA